MTYCVYKINVQPDVLQFYKEDGSLDYLKFEVIPNSFEAILQVTNIKGFYQLIFEKNNKQVDFYKEFNELEKSTDKLIKMYNEIVKIYEEREEIFYSKKFLTLNEKCGAKRRYLETIFPGIKKAYELIDDEQVEKKFMLVTNNQVGTSITHIRKFYKLKMFMEYEEASNALEPLGLESYYNPKTEHLLIKTEREDLASNYVIALNRVLNESNEFTDRVGKININPVYDSIRFEGDFTEISYTIVYPNGNPPQDRDNILRDSQAKEQEVVLIGTDGQPLKKEPIKKILEKEAKKGYLKSFSTKGSKIFSVLKKIKYLDLDSSK
ncbi:hypothetical protein [Vagococcus carniphilus]|uniref:Uncharacterized protein n=1 Tax=Vagococcus carniphilus TaxID=218144 RepID=A0A430AXH8_9ENTE|nr:hypothetical protein [Vagococcus carniphilus]QNN73909.1 hypothetical protein H9L18_04800 [Vagococcus carniphilus]RSU12772.1 hypothetical protein CBF28_10625 [Vagococcus carniphilus]